MPKPAGPGCASPTRRISLPLAAVSLRRTQVFDDNRTGFTVGAGIEIGLVENISAKIEYDFYDFGSKNYNFASITPVAVKSDLHTFIVGLNYKFNWSGGPKP
jgi:opacity protein-like surface antigen